jgi:hypothetical protein
MDIGRVGSAILWEWVRKSSNFFFSKFSLKKLLSEKDDRALNSE